MNETADSQKAAALKKLAEHLAALEAQDQSTSLMESDMVSLIISGILKGENISQRYPTFYQELLQNPELRQVFLDALEAVEAERSSSMVPLPGKPKANLAFLKSHTAAPVLKMLAGQNWQASLERSLEQLQAIFSPPELAYRADPCLEDRWFTMLREEFTMAGITYDVMLDCTISADVENAITPYLYLAITLSSTSASTQFPLRASLQWGAYCENIPFTEEGRAKFPDIPLTMIFDSAQGQLRAGLRLRLETTS